MFHQQSKSPHQEINKFVLYMMMILYSFFISSCITSAVASSQSMHHLSSLRVGQCSIWQIMDRIFFQNLYWKCMTGQILFLSSHRLITVYCLSSLAPEIRCSITVKAINITVKSSSPRHSDYALVL